MTSNLQEKIAVDLHYKTQKFGTTSLNIKFMIINDNTSQKVYKFTIDFLVSAIKVPEQTKVS